MQVQKTKALIPAVLATIGLLGCGEGTSSASNGIQPAIAVAPAGTKTMIDISNVSERAYVRAVLIDNSSGNTLKEERIDCKAHSNDCMMYIPNRVAQAATLLVEDEQRRMIGAYAFSSEGIGSFSYVVPTSRSTGEYLAGRLLKEHLSKDGIDLESATLRLQNFFQNYAGPDGSADPYAELGDYYALQITTSSITENQFIDNLAKRLTNWEIAKTDELPKVKKQAAFSNAQKLAVAFDALISGDISLISTAHAQTAGNGSCSNGLKSFLKLASAAGKIVPKAGPAISGASDMGTKACGADPTSVILAAIAKLKTDVETVNRNLGMLSTYIYDKDIRAANDAFWKLYTDTNVYFSNYSTFLKSAPVPPNKSSLKKNYTWVELDVPEKEKDMAFTNLNGYFLEMKNRGYTTAEAVKYGSKTLKSILNTATVVNNLAGSLTLPNMDTYTAALNNRCASPIAGRPNENFLDVRSFCNTSVLTNPAVIVGTQAGLVGVLKDVYTAIETQGLNSNDYVKPTDVSSYSKAGIAQIEGLFRDSQSKVITPLETKVGASNDTNKGYYNLYAGLPDQLLKNLVAKDCAQIGNGQQHLPNIIGWELPTANRTADSFITTECQLVDARNNMKRPVKARYFFNNQGTGVDANNIANVLGVPVAMHYVTSGQSFNRASTSSEYLIDTQIVFNAPMLVAYNSDQQAGKLNGIVPHKPMSDNATPYVLTGQVNTPINTGTQPAKGQSAIYKASAPQNNGSGKTWVTFKDTKGFNYLVGLGIEYNVYSATSEKRSDAYIRIRCVTEDCHLVASQEWLNFRHGINVDASKTSAGNYNLGPQK